MPVPKVHIRALGQTIEESTLFLCLSFCNTTPLENAFNGNAHSSSIGANFSLHFHSRNYSDISTNRIESKWHKHLLDICGMCEQKKIRFLFGCSDFSSAIHIHQTEICFVFSLKTGRSCCWVNIRREQMRLIILVVTFLAPAVFFQLHYWRTYDIMTIEFRTKWTITHSTYKNYPERWQYCGLMVCDMCLRTENCNWSKNCDRFRNGSIDFSMHFLLSLQKFYFDYQV